MSAIAHIDVYIFYARVTKVIAPKI